MIAATGLRWLLTIAFAAVAVYGVWRASTPEWSGRRGLALRVTHLLHALMALAMVAMAWPWGMSLAAAPQIVFFCAAAAWFAAAAVLAPGARSRAVRAAVPHVLMMAAMAWMLAAMGSAMAGGTGGGGGAMAGMPGMDMSGGSAMSAMTLAGGGRRWTAGLLAAVFLGLALWWLARGFDRARGAVPAEGPSEGSGHGAWDLGCHGVMAGGMAVMFVLLL